MPLLRPLLTVALLALAVPPITEATGVGAVYRPARAARVAAKVHRKRKPRHPAHPATDKSCQDASSPAGPGDLIAMRAALLCLVNRQRVSRGLPALREDSRLDRSAEAWTQSMVSSDQFTHGSDFAARITAAGFPWSYAGENIATGFPTPAAVVKGWMGSLGHCRNILDPGFTRIGIGEVPHAVGGFASGPATWTQDFALPLGASAPSGNAGPQNGCPY